jgi:hypothetical protein
MYPAVDSTSTSDIFNFDLSLLLWTQLRKEISPLKLVAAMSKEENT